MTQVPDFDTQYLHNLAVDANDPYSVDVYMQLGQVREQKGTTAELTFVTTGTTFKLLAPFASMKTLAKFILETVEKYENDLKEDW